MFDTMDWSCKLYFKRETLFCSFVPGTSNKQTNIPLGEGGSKIVVVCWLLNVPATCKCISGTDLLRQFYVLPH